MPAAGGIALVGDGRFPPGRWRHAGGRGGAAVALCDGRASRFPTTGALTVAAAAEANAPGATLALQGESILIQAPLITPSGTGTVALTATGAGETISPDRGGHHHGERADRHGRWRGACSTQAPNAVASLGAIAFETAFGCRSADRAA